MIKPGNEEKQLFCDYSVVARDHIAGIVELIQDKEWGGETISAGVYRIL
jgi:hypothetical protein